MKCFLKDFKGVVYLLVMIMLSQSCVAYKKHPSTIAEATAERNTRIKITTKDAGHYNLRWIEKRDEYVFSIKNTKRIYVKKSKLSTKPALSYRFIETKDEGEYIRGITLTGKDTATVLIPIDQIEEIKLLSKDKTIGLPLTIILVSVFTIPWLIWFASGMPL